MIITLILQLNVIINYWKLKYWVGVVFRSFYSKIYFFSIYYKNIKSFPCLVFIGYEKKDGRHHLSDYWAFFIDLISHFIGVEWCIFDWVVCSYRSVRLLAYVDGAVWGVNRYFGVDWGVFCDVWVSL